MTFGATASIYLYTRYQRNGFALFPLQRHKLTNYSALFLAAWVGSFFGKQVGVVSVGNFKDLLYLRNNKNAIIYGGKSFDSQI